MDGEKRFRWKYGTIGITGGDSSNGGPIGEIIGGGGGGRKVVSTISHTVDSAMIQGIRCIVTYSPPET